jgi:hypothetical protein
MPLLASDEPLPLMLLPDVLPLPLMLLPLEPLPVMLPVEPLVVPPGLVLPALLVLMVPLLVVLPGVVVGPGVAELPVVPVALVLGLPLRPEVDGAVPLVPDVVVFDWPVMAPLLVPVLPLVLLLPGLALPEPEVLPEPVPVCA